LQKGIKKPKGSKGVRRGNKVKVTYWETEQKNVKGEVKWKIETKRTGSN